MKDKNKYKLLVRVICFFTILTGFGQVTTENILDPNYYGFEVTGNDNGWFLQHSEFSITDEKGAGASSRSLKYSNVSGVNGNFKANGVAANTNMQFDLDAGTFTVKTKVWIDPTSDISSFKITVKPAFKSTTIDISSLPKGQWVETESTVTLNSPNTNGSIIVNFVNNSGEKGIVYVDDIQIFAPKAAVAQTLPLLSKLTSTADNNVTLGKGVYEISLKLWVDENTDIPSFYTYINTPFVVSKWGLDNVEKQKWVELKNNFTLNEAANDSEFQFVVSNVDSSGELYQGGFYVDDVVITKVADLESEVVDFEIKVTGETCSGKKNGKVEIQAAETGQYEVTLVGETKTFSSDVVFDSLTPDEYSFCIKNTAESTEQCYSFVVEEAKQLAATISSNIGTSTINIYEGTGPYDVYVNGTNVQQTEANQISVKAFPGDQIMVKSAIDCEGVFSGTQNSSLVYPNPVESAANINCAKESTIYVYSALGIKVLSTVTKTDNASVDFRSLESGIYYVEILTKGTKFVSKLIKQ